MPYLKHERCPKCAEYGKDKTGDNFARYEDGSGYCFSCGHKEWATKYRPTRLKGSGTMVPDDLTKILPYSNSEWLSRYLNPFEIYKYFTYSPKLNRHVFQEGSFWEARSVRETPKTLSHGEKPFVLFGSGDPIVVVEDVVSAIKVARVATSLPLFGSHLSPEWMVRLLKLRPSSICIWLDPDKVQQGRKFSKKINTLAPISRTIETDVDPKCLNTEEIKEKLYETV